MEIGKITFFVKISFATLIYLFFTFSLLQYTSLGLAQALAMLSQEEMYLNILIKEDILDRAIELSLDVALSAVSSSAVSSSSGRWKCPVRYIYYMYYMYINV